MMFNFLPEQLEMLKHLKAVELAKKVDVRFTLPEDDEVSKRRCIYLDGGYDMLNYLLEFDQKYVEEKELEKQKLLEANPSPAQRRADYQSSNQPGF